MKSKWVTLLVICAVLIVAVYAIVVRSNGTHDEDMSKELAQCIGENSAVYVQLGCHACQTQENLFGENYQYLNVIDCYFDRDKCSEISATPTWIINSQTYIGVQSIDKLKELTGC